MLTVKLTILVYIALSTALYEVFLLALLLIVLVARVASLSVTGDNHTTLCLHFKLDNVLWQ